MEQDLVSSFDTSTMTIDYRFLNIGCVLYTRDIYSFMISILTAVTARSIRFLIQRSLVRSSGETLFLVTNDVKPCTNKQTILVCKRSYIVINRDKYYTHRLKEAMSLTQNFSSMGRHVSKCIITRDKHGIVSWYIFEFIM